MFTWTIGDVVDGLLVLGGVVIVALVKYWAWQADRDWKAKHQGDAR